MYSSDSDDQVANKLQDGDDLFIVNVLSISNFGITLYSKLCVWFY